MIENKLKKGDDMQEASFGVCRKKITCNLNI